METRTEISLLDQRDMQRALTRIAHEIVEGNHGAQDLALVGIRRRGVPLAQRLGAMIAGFEGVQVPVGEVDITFYRDDLTARSPQPETHGAQFPFQVDGLHLVMVDDVIYTGRTARAAMDAIMDRGRPASSWRCWWTGDTGSCPSGRIMWGKTSPPASRSASMCWWRR